MVSKGIASVTLWIGNKSFKVNFKIMPLPQQVDAILGMEFFNQYHVWLNPEHKRLLIVDTDASTFDVLTSILNDAENDDANIHMDSATRAHFTKKKKKSAPSSHDKRSEVPHEKIHTSKDGLSEGYHVPQKMLQHNTNVRRYLINIFKFIFLGKN
eukprot:SAG31_NODE_1082_length_10014_cov_5.324962_1_plen_155_part_00